MKGFNYLYLTLNDTIMTTDRNEIKTWILEIPYANTTARNNAKKIGARWNPDKKVWTIECSEYKLDCKNLWKFVKQDVTAEITPPKVEAKAVDMGVGFAVPNNDRDRSIVNQYGFDAIERI